MTQNALLRLVLIFAVLTLTLAGCASRTPEAQEGEIVLTPTPVSPPWPTETVQGLPTSVPVVDLPAPAPIDTPEQTKLMPAPIVQEFPGIRLLEYPLIPDAPELQDCLERSISLSYVYENLYQTRTPILRETFTITEVNQVIQPFGLNIEQKDGYELYKDGQLRVFYYLPDETTFQVSPSGSYVWRIHDQVVDGWMLHNDQVFENVSFQDSAMLMPRFLGEDLVSVRAGYTDESSAFVVSINDQEVYTYTNTGSSYMITDCPAQRLESWEGHWILDLEDDVVMDGRLLRDELGYEQVFEWLLFGGKPLLFYKDDSGYGLNYDGAEVPLPYERLYHQCMSVADGLGCAMSIRQTAETVYFFAVRDGMWYFVEIEEK